VILIMAFSLVFLGVSTVVFSTATNWKDKSAKQTDEIAKLKKALSDANTKVALADGQLKTAQAEHAAQIKDKDQKIAALDTAVKDAEGEMTQARS
jgi:exopolysaccharide biosynthesis protein